jgi:ATP-dependent Lhr-like helicase
MRWWTWAGGGANVSLAAALASVADGHGRVDNLWLRLRPNATVDEFWQALRLARLSPLPAPAVTDEALDGLKFAEALPKRLAAETLASRLGDAEEASRTLSLPDPVLLSA